MAASHGHGRNGLKRSLWTSEEDQKLIRYINRHGVPTRWKEVPKLARLNRCGKSCRLRWCQYLKPGIKRGNISQDEEDTIIRLQSACGNKWVFIADQLPGRTDSEIKNYWNTILKEKLAEKEIPASARLPNPQRHGVGSISTHPAGALPAQGPGFNYQAIEEPTVYYPDQFGPLITSFLNTIPFPQLNQNYAGHVGSLFGNIPPTTQTPTQPLLAVADGLASTAAYLRSYAPGLHSDAQLPNLHSLHNPVVQQGFGDIAPDPEAQLHGVGSISTHPAGALPAQGPGFNYQAMEDPTVYYLGQFGPLITSFLNTIPFPQPNQHYAGHVGSLFGNIPPATQTPIQPLLAVADGLASTAAYLRSYAPGLHSDAQLPNLHSLHNPVVQQGFGDITPDPEAQLHGVGSISTHPAGALPAQGPGFNYQAIEDPTVYYPDQFGPLITSFLNTIPFPQLNQNYAGHVGSLFGNIPPATQTPTQPLLAVADGLASTAAYLRSYAPGLHSDAQLPNLHSLHNPVVQQGFGDITPDPEAQLHGVGSISTHPAGALPAQGPGFNYQAMEDPTVYYPGQFGPLITSFLNTIPFPQPNQHYAGHVGSLFGNIPPATQTPIQPLLAVADGLASTAAYLRSYAPGLHSDAQLPNLHSLHNPVVQQGFGDITPDPEAQLHGVGSISTHPAGALPAQGPGFNYQAIEDPTVYYPDQFGPLITSFLNTIPFPQLNQNYAGHVGSLFGNIPPATQTPTQPLLAVADGLASTAAYLRSYAPGLHSDAQLPNLHSLHNPVVQQGFGDITPDPEAQLHGVGSISTHPAGALPAQGPGFNYQAMEDPTVYYPGQFGPLITSFLNTIPFPQPNQHYAGHVGSLFGNIPPATQTPIQPLLAVADGLASTAAYLRSYAPGLHSDAQLPNLHSLHNPVVQQGFGDITPDPEAQLHGVGSISTDPEGALPSQGPGFNYQAMEDPTVYNHPNQFGPLITSIPNTDLGSLFGNVPNAGSTPDGFRVIRALYD